MRRIKIYNVVFMLIFMMSLLYLSCKKDGSSNGAGNMTVDRVSAQNSSSIDSTITKARLGALIRIDGSGFSSLKAVYVNGKYVSINPSYVSNNHILFSIPSTTPYGKDVADSTVRNTIRLVSASGEYTIPFVIQGAIPVITGVSCTLPAVGDSFQIYGTGLRDISKIEFPGNVVLEPTQFSTNDSTIITCVVPAGATTDAGAILVYTNNGNAASYKYMNYTKGIFIQKFSADATVSADATACSVRVYNYGTNISGLSSALYPTSGQWTKNPAYYRQVPATAGAALDFSGGFDFYSCAALYSVINTTSGDVTLTTSCSSLALQFDYYIPVAWSSGFIRFEWIGDNSSWRYNYAPWALGAGSKQAVTMSGWKTLTIPLNSFTSLNGTVAFGTFLTQVTGKSGKIRFTNSTYTDGGGTAYTASAIDNFNFSFGNFRIVPYSKPTVINN